MCEALLLKRFSEIILADLAADFVRRQAAARHQRRLRFAGLFTATRTAPASALAEAIGCARILVVGAGGGLELKAFAEMQPSWRFDGVDSSAEMFDLAHTTLGKMAPRIRLHEGYIDTAPSGPFDGATCLLTLHFLQREERLQTLKQIRMRLKPGASLVVAHYSFSVEALARDIWLKRSAAFAAVSGVPMAQAEGSIAAIKEQLPVFSPQQDADLLREAGFTGIDLFYCAFTFKGWNEVHGPPNIHESPDGDHASTTVNLLSNMDGPQ